MGPTMWGHFCEVVGPTHSLYYRIQPPTVCSTRLIAFLMAETVLVTPVVAEICKPGGFSVQPTVGLDSQSTVEGG
jgi:hypothetical protein